MRDTLLIYPNIWLTTSNDTFPIDTYMIVICDSRLNLVSSAFFSCQQALTGNSGF